MAVDYVTFRQLVDLSTKFAPKGRSVMLGRQRFAIHPRLGAGYEKILKDANIDGVVQDMTQPDGYTEKMFADLGLGTMETLDYSDFEGADIVHDLNQPVPDELKGQFSFIYDGGTLEHVFDVRQALENMFEMLAVGGRFVACQPINGWPTHGMYQFGPELVYTFWKRKCGCAVHQCSAIAKGQGRLPPAPFPDPAVRGNRVRYPKQMGAGKTFLFYEVERLEDSRIGRDALQSDYVSRWQDHAQNQVGAI